jgi:hypothetical protein
VALLAVSLVVRHAADLVLLPTAVDLSEHRVGVGTPRRASRRCAWDAAGPAAARRAQDDGRAGAAVRGRQARPTGVQLRLPGGEEQVTDELDAMAHQAARANGDAKVMPIRR